VQHDLHIVGVSGTGDMDIDQLVGIFVLGMEGALNQLAPPFIGVGARVRLKTRARVQRNFLHFFLENITLVEKKNDRSLCKVRRVAYLDQKYRVFLPSGSWFHPRTV